MAWTHSGDWTGTDLTNLVRTDDMPTVLHQICTALDERSVALGRGHLKFGFESGSYTYIWDGADDGTYDSPTEAVFYGMPTWMLGYSGAGDPSPVFTHITNQDDALANLCVGEEDYTASGDSYNSFYLKIRLPNLYGMDVHSAYLYLWVKTDVGGQHGIDDIYCDRTDDWSEASSVATVEDLTFNGAVLAGSSLGTDLGASALPTIVNILGDSSKGIGKIYNDDDTGGNATIKFTGTTGANSEVTFTDDLWIGTTSSAGGEYGTEFYDRTSSTVYWRVYISYTDPNWADPDVGGIIGQFRRAIESLSYPYGPIPFNGMKFYNFVDSEDWTLSSLLGKGSYGTSWVTLDRWQNPDIWMQIQEAIEELTYVREEKPFFGHDPDDCDGYYENALGIVTTIPNISTLQTDMWDNMVASDIPDGAHLLFAQGTTAADNYSSSPGSWNAPSMANIQFSIRAKSINFAGTFSSAKIFYKQQKGISYLGYYDENTVTGGAGSHTVVDDFSGGGDYNWNPDQFLGETIDEDESTQLEAWADACLAEPDGLKMIFSVSLPGTNPCEAHPSLLNRTNPDDLIKQSGKIFTVSRFQINRVLSVGNGLTYG